MVYATAWSRGPARLSCHAHLHGLADARALDDQEIVLPLGSERTHLHICHSGAVAGGSGKQGTADKRAGQRRSTVVAQAKARLLATRDKGS